jgi:hypothetical protein
MIMENLDIVSQMSNLAKDLHKLILSGRPIIAPPETIKARMDACNMCEFYKNSRCTKCGCFMEVKVKLLSLECPIGKW